MASAAFTLLLPVYAGDTPDALRLALESSTVGQSLMPAEVLVVIDGPISAALEAVIDEFEAGGAVPLTRVRFAENRGLTEGLNAGLERARYDVVARMDADDVSVPDRFAKQWPLVEAGYDLVGAGMVEFDDDPEVCGVTRIPPVGEANIRSHARTHNPFNHPTMMYRVSRVREVGGYEPFGKMEDYWLGIRMIASGARVENIAEPLVKYRVGSGAFARRGGWREAQTEIRLQKAMLGMGFIGRGEYLRNVVMKSAYRMLPASVKQVLFRRFVAGGLPSDQKSKDTQK